ncbi:MAG: SRPBCC family protein [Betaproteobacteria bacterium]|nr:MAG: SRPBCC family protein [Betaproteobacteria bacterium]
MGAVASGGFYRNNVAWLADSRVTQVTCRNAAQETQGEILLQHERTGVEAETTLEAGKAGDQVGAVRRVSSGGKIIRQALLAHSDVERSYTYALCNPPPFPVRNYVATIRVTPVVDGNQAFVEWWATFDCAAEEYDHWRTYFEQQGFAKWLSALRHFMAEARV